MNRLKKGFRTFIYRLSMSFYVFSLSHFGIKDYWILLDSKNGQDLGSNLLRIAEELIKNPDYQKYKVFISCNKEKKQDIKLILKTYHLQRIKVIEGEGFRYKRIISLAKYLITDTSFPTWYVKKEGQVITNTWHGTPLKHMGKDNKEEAYRMGNVQRNHLIADYLLYPSDYMKEIMFSAYFLDNLYQGKVLYSGYPRNSVFFDTSRAKTLREELNLNGKTLYGYMPTWRGSLGNVPSEKIGNQLEFYFRDLDAGLQDNEIFLVRLHPYVENLIDYSQYKHIKKFPEGYDPYDILNMCDCLVTDYSSVLFDFANTGRKIVLFVYDKELYMTGDGRGAYFLLDDFPFPQVRTVPSLLKELHSPKKYDDIDFRKEFCQYDGVDVAKKICSHVIKGEQIFDEYSANYNGKDNVLIYAGNFAKNGITTVLINLLNNIDKGKRNYFISFRSNISTLKGNPNLIFQLPADVGFFPIASITGRTVGENLALNMYFRHNIFNRFVKNRVDQFYSRLYQRTFGSCDFKYVIQFVGYERDIINMFLQAPAKRMIFVHSDMVKEIQTRGSQHELSLRRAYHNYDKVALVSDDIFEPTLFLGENRENMVVVHNCHDYRTVLRKAEEELIFDEDTISNVSLDKLKDILMSTSGKFITIGRFSPEKGHEMLMKAFDKYYSENPDSYLIIIGGHGELYDETIVQASILPSADHIVIIKSMSNPMPVLKRCDLFILSSLYEGLPTVLFEADTLGIPVISTDVQGPKGIMTDNGGYLVPADVEGIYSGMKAFDRGEVKVLNVDYEKYNQQSVQQFEELFEEDKEDEDRDYHVS